MRKNIQKHFQYENMNMQFEKLDAWSFGKYAVLGLLLEEEKNCFCFAELEKKNYGLEL